MTMNLYDVIIIGSGAGGGTLLHRLAPGGKRILVLERGPFLPREKANWDAHEVFGKDRYHTSETWLDRHGKLLHPGTGYWVGGNTKVYGAALLRLRQRDFDEVLHAGGTSPAWPLKYTDFAPYYDQAEKLYSVHGARGEDPTDPARNADFPHPPVGHEPRIQALSDRLAEAGLHPFHLPLGIRLVADDPLNSPCIRCDTCDGFPCLIDAKADADTTCVRPALKWPNVTLMTDTMATRLVTDGTGRRVVGVEVESDGRQATFRADTVILAGGAVNSAALLLRSAGVRHPDGLANGSGQVGRNFMKHNALAMLAISREANLDVFQKTIGVNDFYWGEPGYEHPMGHIQLLGRMSPEMMAVEAPPITPGFTLEAIASHSVGWWLTGEDLPFADNRVHVENDRIVLEYHERNTDGFNRLAKRWQESLRSAECGDSFIPCSLHLRKKIPLAAVGHQCGTCRMGEDPGTSVLNLDCRTHDVDNLYVVDGSFFPSSAAVNPSLTIMANALRVADHLLEHLS